MPEIKVGDLVRVLDASPTKGGKRPKFAKDAELRIVAVSPAAGLQVRGTPGFWRAERFGRIGRG